MFVLIKDNNSFTSVDLNKIDNYLYKGIEFYKDKDDYFISLRKGFYFKEKDKLRKLEIKKYIIKNQDVFNDIEIYVYKNNLGIDEYCLYENSPFVLSCSNKGNIICHDSYLKEYYLAYKDKVLKTNSDFLLLNKHLYNNEVLKDGDEISFFNFCFIYHDDYLYMNHFNVDIRLNKKMVDEKIIRYQNNKVPIKNYYICDVKKLDIGEIEAYKEIKVLNQKKLIFQIGPSLTMTLAMCGIAGINVYNNYLNGLSINDSLVYILMPASMLISGLFWPIMARAFEKSNNKKEIKANKNKYLEYLNNYYLNLNKDIDDYLKDLNSYFFDGTVDENKLFYLTAKSSQFLNISIGHITLSKEFKCPCFEDDEVKEKINGIKYRLKHIENYPYFLDLKKYHTISIISNNGIYLVKRFLLELSSKYHFEDFNIALYSEDLNVFEKFFGLPQLILNNRRLTFNKQRQLQELDSMKLDLPLVLLCFGKVDFNIKNKMITTLYFVKSMEDILKNSDLVIEYKDDGGIIYDDELINFKYHFEAIDFNLACELLGGFQKVDFLNKTISFLDVYPNLSIKDFYSGKQSGLRADFALVGNEVLNFDLHESKNGPHGLIGGSTGSGKSELIVSLLLSLAIRYRPDYLNIILIDYKGGGIEESLSYKGKRLPHIIASINNLENDVLKRLMVAIDFECKRRQRLFKELSNKALVSIMNLDDYLECDLNKYGMEKIAHLIIVVDEFAQLKKENPEIIKELIAFSRIGRSLGVHLILATQRPSGVIDDEIWSNSRFKIALKVLSEKDSNDIIKSNKAFYLSDPGQFYLCFDDSLIKGKSLYSKLDINNSDPYKVALLDNTLRILDKKQIKQENITPFSSLAIREILKCKELLKIDNVPLDFKRSPCRTIDEISKYYNVKDFIYGEKDDYLKAYKGPLVLNREDNIFIYSSRNKEVNNILNHLNRRSIVIGKCRYKNKYISDSLLYEDQGDLLYLFNKLLDYNGALTLVIEDINCLFAYNDEYLNYLYQIIRRSKFSGINIIAISSSSNMNFKLLNSFKNKLVIEINDRQDLLNIFSTSTNYVGKSFYFDEEIISFVPCKIEEFKEDEPIYESFITKIPSTILFESNYNKCLLGIDLKNRVKLYLENNEEVLISSYDEDLIIKYQKLYRDFDNVSVALYNNDLAKKDYVRYIWLGEGLFNQRLFYVSRKEDLKSDEAYYYKGNKGCLIRMCDE